MNSGTLAVRRYDSGLRRAWNAFVHQSKNGTFLHLREYMDYHADRFLDHSLAVWKESALFAVLPANEHERELVSHGGLTYGGLIVDQRVGVADVLASFDAVREYLSRQGFRMWRYKPVPHIYHVRPAEEDLYALFRSGARLTGRSPSAAIHLHHHAIPGKKRNGAARAARAGLCVRQVQHAGPLMEAVARNLQCRHGVDPVHDSSELDLLRARFPRNIEIFQLELHGQVAGGAVMYVTTRVAHAQYLLVTDIARPLRGMDLLVDRLTHRYRTECDWFDFGISSEEDGRVLNGSLMSHKEEFGAFAVAYDNYEIEIAA